MLLADVGGARMPPAGTGRGTCPHCGAPVIARCGAHVAWHWAHESRADCDSWAEPAAMTRGTGGVRTPPRPILRVTPEQLAQREQTRARFYRHVAAAEEQLRRGELEFRHPNQRAERKAEVEAEAETWTRPRFGVPSRDRCTCSATSSAEWSNPPCLMGLIAGHARLGQQLLNVAG
jgi:Competence protein CoiA-like family